MTNQKLSFNLSTLVYVLIAGIGLYAFLCIGSITIPWFGGKDLVLFPTLRTLKYTIDYYFFVVLWFLIQVITIVLLYEVIANIEKGYKFIKFKLMDFDKRIKNYIFVMK